MRLCDLTEEVSVHLSMVAHARTPGVVRCVVVTEEEAAHNIKATQLRVILRFKSKMKYKPYKLNRYSSWIHASLAHLW